jgi:hypothetical protein
LILSLIIHALTIYVLVYVIEHMKFGFKGMNVLLKAVVGEWITEIAEKKKEIYPTNLVIALEALHSFSSNYLFIPFPFITTVTLSSVSYVLCNPSLLEPPLFSTYIQKITYVFPFYLSNLSWHQ